MPPSTLPKNEPDRHLSAKQAIFNAKEITVPPIVVWTSWQRGVREVLPAKQVRFDAVILEPRRDGFSPDSEASVRGRRVFIEIYVSNCCDPNKKAKFRSYGVPAFEISVP